METVHDAISSLTEVRDQTAQLGQTTNALRAAIDRLPPVFQESVRRDVLKFVASALGSTGTGDQPAGEVAPPAEPPVVPPTYRAGVREPAPGSVPAKVLAVLRQHGPLTPSEVADRVVTRTDPDAKKKRLYAGQCLCNYKRLFRRLPDGRYTLIEGE